MRTEPLKAWVKDEVSGARCALAPGAKDAMDCHQPIANGAAGDVGSRRVGGFGTTSSEWNRTEGSTKHADNALAEFGWKLRPFRAKN